MTDSIDPSHEPADPELALRWWAHQNAWLADKSRFRIALKARQIGWSTVLAAEALSDAVGGATTIICSASERQSNEALRRVRQLLPVVKATGGGAIEVVRESSDCVELSTGGRVLSIPASASTVQGFSGNVILDEFAWTPDQDNLWLALVPTITASDKFRLSVVSTPRARGDRFHKLWTECDERVWSKHRTTIEDAKKGGLPHDLAALKAGISDEVVWRSMYCCEFVDEAYALLPYNLLQSCTDDSLPYRASLPELAKAGNLFVGVDIGRLHDLTVFSFLELQPDEVICRGFIEMKGESFEHQEDILRRIMGLENVVRAVIDSTGLGLQLAERAVRRFGSRVIPAVLTMPLKEKLCSKMRRVFELGQISIPNDATLLADLHSIEKSITEFGNVRYSAQRGKKGHADRFMSLALALIGCDRAIGRKRAADPTVILHKAAPSRREQREISAGLTKIRNGLFGT